MSMINKKQLVNAAMLSALTVGAFSFGPQEISAEEGYVPISRIEGKDRYETAALISNETYASADTVVIANAMNFADALSGVPLAYQNEAPILLAHGTKLKTSIISEIERLGATNAIILGGEAAISSEISQQLKDLGLITERLAGDNRFETSALIADELTSTMASDTAVVVDGMEFADAMSIAPIAAQKGMPIYLTKTNSLSNAEDLKEYTSTYIVGGENAVSKTVESSLNNVTRLHGLDRYETNRDVIKHFGIESNKLFLATGLNFSDALSGSVFAAKNNSAVALIKGDVHSKLIGYLNSYPVDSFTILGGEAAVSNKVAHTLNSYLNIGVGVENETPEGEFHSHQDVDFDVTAGHTRDNPVYIDFPDYALFGGLFVEDGSLAFVREDGPEITGSLSLDGGTMIIRPYPFAPDAFFTLTVNVVEETPVVEDTPVVEETVVVEDVEDAGINPNDVAKADSYYEVDHMLNELSWSDANTTVAYNTQDDLFQAGHMMTGEAIQKANLEIADAYQLMMSYQEEFTQVIVDNGYLFNSEMTMNPSVNESNDIAFTIVFN